MREAENQEVIHAEVSHPHTHTHNTQRAGSKIALLLASTKGFCTNRFVHLDQTTFCGAEIVLEILMHPDWLEPGAGSAPSRTVCGWDLLLRRFGSERLLGPPAVTAAASGGQCGPAIPVRQRWGRGGGSQ